LLVHTMLAKNIHKVIRHKGHVLMLQFRFKGKRKLCVIQVYLPNNKKQRNDIQNYLEIKIKEERLNNSNIIIMGDFNAVNEPLTDRSREQDVLPNESNQTRSPRCLWKPEAQIFPFLEDLGFLDIHKHWEEISSPKVPISHTWKNTVSSSRIDYMWLSQDLAINIYSFKNKAFDHITNSDHTLLQVSIFNDEILGYPKRADTYKKKPRTIANLKEMTKEKWIEYSNEIEKEIDRLQILKTISRELMLSNKAKKENANNDNKVLQKIWKLIENTITKVGKRIIPTKKISRKK
jgi:exonuclease III